MIEPADSVKTTGDDGAAAIDLADCFLRVSRLQFGTFELLSRYEAALWRQAAQLLFLLPSAARRSNGEAAC